MNDDCARVYDRLWIGAWSPGLVGHIIMCAPWRHYEDRSGSSLYFPFADDIQPPSMAEEAMIERAAFAVRRLVDREFDYDAGFMSVLPPERTVVCCREGKNRSGVVVARVLMMWLRKSADEAISMVRSVRPGALYNTFFCGYLRSLSR